MIVIHITPTGVQEIQFKAQTDYVEDMDLAVWPLVRAHLQRLDGKLKRASKKALDQFDREERDGDAR